MLGAVLVVLGLAAAAVLALGAAPAQAAIVGAVPTWPISAAVAGPPPVPVLPAATGAAPPASQIADPLTPAAACGGWYQQDHYGDRPRPTSTWWEYRCTRESAQYYNTCAGPACDAFCPTCSLDTQQWADYFYWDGSDAVFSGQAYTDSVAFDSGDSYASADWWDGPAARWYAIGPYLLTVTKQGTGSGVVTSTPAGLACGFTCQASFDPGAAVTLTAAPDAGSVFTGWSGDCTGTGACQVTLDQARAVTAAFTPTTFPLTVSVQGTGSGQVTSAPAGIACGFTCQAAFGAGTAVTLTAAPGAGSVFTGWSGDCTGAGACQVTMDQARAVGAGFALNMPPQASFTLTCTGLTCTFDGSGAADPDGSIAGYAWDFGDGASGSGKTVAHTYGRAGSYTVTLTVTDTAGAAGSDAKAVNPISLSARGYKQNGLQKVDLSWSGPGGASFDIARDTVTIATVQASTYTDTINNKGPATYTYRVCAPATSSCSNRVTISF
jgi:PKD repeat protein